MTRRRVRFTVTARGQIRREKSWWIQNRIHTEVFAAEFEEAVKILAILPGAGTSYPDADVDGLRRVYLRRIACHLYYTFDDQEVRVRALWSARRSHGPFIEP